MISANIKLKTYLFLIEECKIGYYEMRIINNEYYLLSSKIFFLIVVYYNNTIKCYFKNMLLN